MRLGRAFAAATLVLMGAGPTLAFEPTLTDQQAADAADAGQQQAASKSHGFEVKQYVLFDRQDPLYIGPDDQLVDAVIVGTPRERLLYQGYLSAFQGTPMSPKDAADFAGTTANTIAFRVFAHAPSADEKDRDFLTRFGQATLTLADGTKLTADEGDVFGPGEDFFILRQNKLHVFRWLGSLNYTFDLGGLISGGTDISSLTGTLSFTGPAGQNYSYDVDLSKYQ